MTPSEIVGITRDLLIATATVATAFVAIYGINSWRRETTGKARFGTAKDLLRSTFDLRDALADARVPLISSWEFPADYTPMSNADHRADGLGHVYRNRWQPVGKTWATFRDRAVEAEVIFGDHLKQYTSEIDHCVHIVSVSIEALVANERSGGRNFDSDREFGRKIQSEVQASRKDDDNEINRRMHEAELGIAQRLRKELS